MSGSSDTRSSGSPALSLFVGLMILASPARTDVIPSGIDVWHTAQGGGTTIDIPAGALEPPTLNDPGCPEAPIQVPAHGVAIATSPDGVLGETDTVLYRPNAVDVPRGGSKSTALRIVALSLEGDSPVTPAGCANTWTVSASLGNRSQPTGSISIGLHESGLGGTYSASFDVDAVLKATSGSLTRTMNLPRVTISTTSADWAHKPGAGGVEGDPDLIDTNGDGVPDTDFPGTFGFAPGWLCDDFTTCDNPVVSDPEHTGPHIGVSSTSTSGGC